MKSAPARIGALVLAGLVAATTVACTAGGPATSDPVPAVTTDAASSSPSAAPRTPAQVSGILTVAPRTGVAFVLPDGWETFDLRKLTQTPASEWPQAFVELAAVQGVDPQDYLDRNAQQIELMSAARGNAGPIGALDVIPAIFADVPTDDVIADQARANGWSLVSIEKPDVYGAGVKVANYVATSNGVTVYGRWIVVVTYQPTTGGILSVIGRSDAEASEIAHMILTSLSVV